MSREPFAGAGYDHRPWDLRKRVIPLQTWSGRVVHDRKKHYFRMADAKRVMDSVQPPQTEKEASIILSILKAATLEMMEKLLFFLDDSAVESIYDFCISVLDKLFKIASSSEKSEPYARRVIAVAADLAGLSVTIKK